MSNLIDMCGNLSLGHTLYFSSTHGTCTTVDQVLATKLVSKTEQTTHMAYILSVKSEITNEKIVGERKRKHA